MEIGIFSSYRDKSDLEAGISVLNRPLVFLEADDVSLVSFL